MSASATEEGASGPLPGDEEEAAPWRRRAVLYPVGSIVVFFVAGALVAALPGELTSFASLFVGITWSLAGLIALTLAVFVGSRRVARFLRGLR